MRTVLRYDVPVDDQPHEIAAGAVLHAAAERFITGSTIPRVEVWIECFTPENRLPEQTMTVQVFGTGQRLPANARWLRTCLDGRLVWHLYELAEVDNGEGYKGFEET